jgi:hypothetical protein
MFLSVILKKIKEKTARTKAALKKLLIKEVLFLLLRKEEVNKDDQQLDVHIKEERCKILFTRLRRLTKEEPKNKLCHTSHTLTLQRSIILYDIFI